MHFFDQSQKAFFRFFLRKIEKPNGRGITETFISENKEVRSAS